MKKTISIISVVAVLLLAVALGIFVIPFYRLPAPVTLWEKKQLEKEYGKYGISPPQWMDKNGEGGFTFYFGKYNGYYIIFDTYDVDWCWGETVGEYEFKSGSCSIIALKDGKSYTMSELYAKGELTDKDIAKIYEYYLEI